MLKQEHYIHRITPQVIYLGLAVSIQLSFLEICLATILFSDDHILRFEYTITEHSPIKGQLWCFQLLDIISAPQTLMCNITFLKIYFYELGGGGAHL